MKAKDVSIDEVIVESEGSVVQRLDKAAIAELQERGKKEGNPYWVFGRNGVKFSHSRDCAKEAASPEK